MFRRRGSNRVINSGCFDQLYSKRWFYFNSDALRVVGAFANWRIERHRAWRYFGEFFLHHCRKALEVRWYCLRGLFLIKVVGGQYRVLIESTRFTRRNPKLIVTIIEAYTLLRKYQNSSNGLWDARLCLGQIASNYFVRKHICRYSAPELSRRLSG